MVEDLRRLNGTDPIPPAEDSFYVRGAVESSAQSTKTFLALADPVRARIITGMIEILAPVEAKNRGRWCADRAEIGIWEYNTLATLRGNVKYDDEEGVKETEEAILLRQLAKEISKEFEIHLHDLFTSIKIIFKRSMTTMDSGFKSYDEAKKHREKSKDTGELGPGGVINTKEVRKAGQSTALVKALF